MPDFNAWPVWGTLGVFAGAALVVWIAGVRLEASVEVISRRTGLGSAFGGLVLLALATSLPELATTVTGALLGNAALLTNNLLGGVAMQMTVLVFADAVLRRGALTFFAPSYSVLLGGVSLVLLLAVTLAVLTAGDPFAIGWIGIGAILIFAVHLTVVYFTYRAGAHPRWQPIRPQEGEEEAEQRATVAEKHPEHSLRWHWTAFGVCSAAILVAGWAVMRTAEALTEQTGIGASFIGATLVAIATSLPEVSTTTAAVRRGNYEMAISNIFGSNLWDVSLLFIGDLFFRSGPLLAVAPRQAMFTASLGIVLTCIYLWGLLERRNKTVGVFGIDSLVAMIVYLAGLAVLYRMG